MHAPRLYSTRVPQHGALENFTAGTLGPLPSGVWNRRSRSRAFWAVASQYPAVSFPRRILNLPS